MNLFNELMELCNTNEAFYFADQTIENYTIRSFTYRLASYSDFMGTPCAVESRGTAFIKENDSDEWKIACRAYPKFWNLGEGIPMKDYIKNNSPLVSFEKLDGSLILVLRLPNGKLIAKSKSSINSEQAHLANKFLEENESYRNMCNSMINIGLTPVFEGIGRKNVIVLRYDVDFELRFLGSVNMKTGKIETVSCETSEKRFKHLFPNVKFAKYYNYSWDELLEIQKTSKPNIEGFVVRTQSGFVKCKVNTYTELHHAKDSVQNIRALIATVLEDNTDDLIGLFRDDQETIAYIQKVQDAVFHKFNHLVIEYKELRRKYFQDFGENRKEFAQKYKSHPLFSGVMKSIHTSFRDVEDTAEKNVKIYFEKQCSKVKTAEAFMKDLLGD